MELIRGRHNLRPRHRGCVLTIGTFDGVHLGHQAVIRQLVRTGQALALPNTLMTFEPTPLEFFAGPRAPGRLTRMRDKLMLLDGRNLDRLLCLRFDAALANLSAERFVEELLVDGLGARAVIVGDDFRFGHQARGNFDLLEHMGRCHGFEVLRQDTYTLDGDRVSSTRVREALAAGDLALARRLLGHPYRISGRVRHGERIGRTLGWPTANIGLSGRRSALAGILAVRVWGTGIEDGHPGVASLGTRPTVNGRETVLEVHLFDFAEHLYGRLLTVEFVHWLRAEERFPSLDALRAQIAEDARRARALLDLSNPPAI